MTMIDPGAGTTSRHATQCAACGAALRPRFEKVVDPQSLETFSIVECTACGLGHTDPQPADLAPYYGAKYHGGRHSFTDAWCIARRLRFLRKASAARSGKLLDVGCGDGRFLEAAREAGWTGFGVEMNPEPPRARGFVVESTVEALASSGPFDVVTFWHSLEHFRDPRAALEAATKVLAPGGTLIVAVPDAGGFQARAWGAKWFHLDVPRHLFHFTSESLERLLGGLGLRTDHRWHQEIEIDLFGWIQSPLNAVHQRQPNRLFKTLTGRANDASLGEKALDVLTATAIAPLAAAATAGSTALGKGGTLVFAARAR